jgi:hypothetical protein
MFAIGRIGATTSDCRVLQKLGTLSEFFLLTDLHEDRVQLGMLDDRPVLKCVDVP